MKIVYVVGMAILGLLWASQPAPASNLPISREGTLIESVSSAEVMVKAKGIGHWVKGDSKKYDIDRTLNDLADEDGRKAAVYFVLFGGTDPLLNPEAAARFESLKEGFFASDNISKYISWEGTEYITRVKKDIKKNKEYELHIEKAYKINKQLLTDYLAQCGVIAATASLTEMLGMPFIMVIPAVGKGENPIEKMRADPNLSHGAKVIESYLTARKYDVVVPEQAQDLSALASAQAAVKGVQEDYSYQLALSIGSDVYITYEVTVTDEKFGAQKASASVRAYETTTARLLGTETGYSPAAQTAPMVLIESAVNDAIDKVLSRINEYWKEDLRRGAQYKLIVSIMPGYSSGQIEDLTFAFGDMLAELGKKGAYKENTVTDQTLDYVVWCDASKFDKSSNLYRWMKEDFEQRFPAGKLNRVNLNRKMLLLKVEP